MLGQELPAQANCPRVIGHSHHHPSVMPTPSCASITTPCCVLFSNSRSEIISFICLPPTRSQPPECQIWPVSKMALRASA